MKVLLIYWLAFLFQPTEIDSLDVVGVNWFVQAQDRVKKGDYEQMKALEVRKRLEEEQK